MKIVQRLLNDVLVIKPDIFNDNRGFFFESYSYKKMQELGVTCDFVQDNHSLSKSKDTIRGMHFQHHPMAQTKLVRVIAGEIENFVVDIRKESKSYLKYESVVISNDNKLLLYIPKGFANGFKTLTENCEVIYKVDNYYSPEHDVTFRYDDPEIGINWNIDNPTISERDKHAKLFSEISGKAEF